MAKKKDAEKPYEPKILNDEELANALANGKAHREDLKTLEDRKRMIDADIIATLFERGETDTTSAQGSWKIESKITRTLSVAKLVAAGVDPKTIEECTDENNSAPYLKLYPKREPKGDA